MNVAVSKTSKLAYAAGVIALTMVFLVTPFATHADEIASHTAQILPPGANTACPHIPVTSYKNNIYQGALNSFDVTISDPTYVAVVGSVGNMSIPFQYMTRSVDQLGNLTYHVDTPSVSVGKSLVVSMVLLSSKGVNTPVCAATVSITIGAKVAASAPTRHVSNGTAGKTATLPTSVTGKVLGEPTKSPGSEGQAEQQTVVSSGVHSTLQKMCDTVNGATRLWTVLLAVYLLIIAATVLAQPTARPDDQSAFLMGAAIVVPLGVLLAVWLTTPSCRIGAWVPIASLLIAVAGFVLGFRHHPSFSKVFTPSPPDDR